MKTITLLPADSYVVINKTIITEYDKKVIIDLYQPIIGPIAVSLYFTFISDLDKYDNRSDVLSHHHLMIMLKSGLDVIKKACSSLESVGLIKTFVKLNDNQNNYIYEIYSPISPNEFLNHPVLNIVLYNNIGDTEYKKLCNHYKKIQIDMKEYEDISSTLSSTYTSINNNIRNDSIKSREEIGINVGEVIDFDTLISSIPNNIISDKAFNKRTMILTILTIIVIIGINQFTSLLEVALKDTQYSDTLTNDVWKQSGGTNALRVIVYSVPMIFSLIGKKYIDEANNPIINICVNCSVVTSLLYLVSMVTSGIFIGRLPIYTSLTSYILLPWLIDHMFEKKSAFLVKMMMYGFYFLFFYYQMHFAWGAL